ncbi:uncharacterized protein LOC143055210 [Mytilus galloprovincialis]|uniref:uncharacterized protein LOC143055210 n=1 Tax=Mytilus galloprovincialis TaxID=29158 RepID=UPI003F7B4C50
MLLLICSLYVLCVDSVPENSILNTQQSTGTELSQICTPVGLNKNQIHRPQTIKRSTNRELVWIGAFVLYTPWMEFKGCASAKMNINIQNYKVNTSSELNVYECHKKCSNISDYIGMQQQACYCLSEIHLNEPSSCLNVKECNNFLCYRKKDIYSHQKYQDTVALYALNSTFPVNKSQLDQCGVFNYYDSVSYGSKRCSDTSHPVCYKNKPYFQANKGHANKSLSWSDSMKFCRETSPSSVKNLESKINMTHGSYWTTSVRAEKFIPVKDVPKRSPFHCVAAYISQNNVVEEYVKEHCDKSLPVLCLKITERVDLTTNTQYNSSTTPINMINDKDKEEQISHIPWEIIAGCFGLIGVIITIALVILKCKKRSPKSTGISIEETGMNHSATSNEEPLEADNENVYDDSNSKERCAILKDKDYDSMSVIRQETEGVYDHTSSANITPKPVEDVNIYDHADPVFIKQSLQIENDGVYNKCELDVKSVITNAQLKSDTNTIYDHA